MKNSLLVIIFLLVNPLLFSQQIIGDIDGVQILNNEDHYEVIFKTQKGHFSSFYINKDSSKNGYEALKKYIFLLFSSREKNEYLLQFKKDSVF